jgi:hypothetical protein
VIGLALVITGIVKAIRSRAAGRYGCLTVPRVERIEYRFRPESDVNDYSKAPPWAGVLGEVDVRSQELNRCQLRRTRPQCQSRPAWLLRRS